MSDNVSLTQLENEIRAKLEEYDNLVDTAYDAAHRRNKIKDKLTEDERNREASRAQLIRLVGIGIAAVACLIFYKLFFGW